MTLGTDAVIAGVDLGGTKIQVAVSHRGEVSGTAKTPTPDSGAHEVTQAIRRAVFDALTDAGSSLDALAGVGVGAPGRIEGDVVSHSPNIPGLGEPYPLGRQLSELLGGVAVTLENDVTAATLGELNRGAGRPFRHVLGVFVGTGVGGGIAFDRSIVRGRGAAGEIGHVIVKPEGRRCGCGGRGHLEAYAGKAGIERHAQKQVDGGASTVLLDLMRERGREHLTSGMIARALARGDELTKSLVDDAVWALGVGLASVQNLLDVDAIVLGGGLADRLGEPFRARISDAMEPLLFVRQRPPALVASELGDLSGAIGAIVLASD
jgi:glucokinase